MARVRQVEDDPRVSADALVGREEELRAIDALLGGAPERGGALLVRGEPGIGKSTLLAQARRRGGAAGLRVLTAAGVQSESDLPFAGLHQLLRPVLDHLGALAGPQRNALQSAFGLGERPAPDRFLIALAALDLLSEAADAEPLLAIVEDAHWLDRASADVLAFVARRLESDPILLIAALRDGFESPLAAAGLPELALERLDAADAESLLDGRAPGLARGLRERILREAGGNPLALVELPIAIERLGDRVLPPADLPLTDRLEHAFAVRAAELPARTRALLLVAAFDDGESLGTVLAAGEGLGEGLSIADLSPAVAAGLLEMDETRIRFRHPLVRSAIRRAAGPGRRQQIHASLARALAGEPERAVWHRAAAVVGTDEAVAGELEATRPRRSAAAGWRHRRRGARARGGAHRRARAPRAAAAARRPSTVSSWASARSSSACSTRPRPRARPAGPRTRDLDPRELRRRRPRRGRRRPPPGRRRRADGSRRATRSWGLDLLGGATLRCWWGDPDEGTAGRRRDRQPAAPAVVRSQAGHDPRLGRPRSTRAQKSCRRLRGSRPARHVSGRGLRLYGIAATAVGRPRLAARSCAPRGPAYATTGRRRCSTRRWCCAGWGAVRLGAWPAAVGRSRGGRAGSRAVVAALLDRSSSRRARRCCARLHGDRDGAQRWPRESERVALPGRATAALADRPARARHRVAGPWAMARMRPRGCPPLRPRCGAPLHGERLGDRRPAPGRRPAAARVEEVAEPAGARRTQSRGATGARGSTSPAARAGDAGRPRGGGDLSCSRARRRARRFAVRRGRACSSPTAPGCAASAA